jgi:Na+/phosphate symporter
MFIPMILSFVAGIMLTFFSVKSIKAQGANFFGVSGCILGLALISIAVYLALPQ